MPNSRLDTDRDARGRFIAGNETAHKGGQAVVAQYGAEHMAEIGRVGYQHTAAKKSRAWMQDRLAEHRRLNPSRLEIQVMVWLGHLAYPTYQREYKVKVARRVFYLDFAWPNRKVAVEVNGHYYHTMEKPSSGPTWDSLRISTLEGLGWHVLTLSESEIESALALTYLADLRPRLA